MGHIKEPDGVDFIIQSKPLTTEERTAISAYIHDYKTKAKQKTKRTHNKITVRKTKQTSL